MSIRPHGENFWKYTLWTKSKRLTSPTHLLLYEMIGVTIGMILALTKRANHGNYAASFPMCRKTWRAISKGIIGGESGGV